MKDYALYATKNLLLLKKSKVDAKLDSDLWNIAKKHAMEANLLADEDVNYENDVKDLEVEDKNNIDISTTNSYLHVVIISYKYWIKQNTTDCLESFVLFHLYHFLCIADNASIANHRIYYNLNVFKPNS